MKKTGAAAWLLYIAVRAVLAIMQAFPLDWNLRTAQWMARVWARLLPRHRRRAITHLREAYGDELPEPRIAAIADACLESVTMFAVEAICLPRLVNAFTWSRYVRLVNFEGLLELMLGGKGAILVTGHYGSFELVGHVLACLGFRIVAVMRPLDNVYLNGFIVSSRRTHGLTLLDKKGAMTRAESLLSDGALLGFIGDQDAGRKGLFVEFFGRPASTYKSIGLLAIATRVPIVVGYARRRGRRPQYDLGVQRIIYPQEWEAQEDPLRWVTQAYSAAIEAFVREDPSQYLWIHRRWKSQPRSSPVDRAPPAPSGVAAPSPTSGRDDD
ncbi:MAG: lysophospholipid acyltransferase family protein [Planctomycetes bacterium]|nr:lysophospholipid acyltransferase family protein [Planctomycetota bacterium]